MSQRSCRGFGWGRAVGAGLLLASALWPAQAHAQLASPPVPQSGTGSSVTGARSGVAGANPFANPYSNPFLNPLMTQQQMSPGQAALYFFAAQQASGGVGSGRLGGPNALNPREPRAGRPVAPPRKEGSNVPGARAANFFNRTNPTAVGANSYYNRQIRSFPENGR